MLVQLQLQKCKICENKVNKCEMSYHNLHGGNIL